jgi:hypothetical protein
LEEFLDVRAFYVTPAGDSKEGVFKIRRNRTRIYSQLLPLCTKRNPQTGAVVEHDDMKMGKLVLVSRIVDCPIMVNGQNWKDSTDILAKLAAFDEYTEDDVFEYLAERAKSMRRFPTLDENLSTASSIQSSPVTEKN